MIGGQGALEREPVVAAVSRIDALREGMDEDRREILAALKGAFDEAFAAYDAVISDALARDGGAL